MNFSKRSRIVDLGMGIVFMKKLTLQVRCSGRDRSRTGRRYAAEGAAAAARLHVDRDLCRRLCRWDVGQDGQRLRSSASIMGAVRERRHSWCHRRRSVPVGNLVFGAEGNLGGALSKGLGTAGCNPPAIAFLIFIHCEFCRCHMERRRTRRLGVRLLVALRFRRLCKCFVQPDALCSRIYCLPNRPVVPRRLVYRRRPRLGGLGEWWSASNIATIISSQKRSYRLPRPGSVSWEISMLPHPSSTPSVSG